MALQDLHGVLLDIEGTTSSIRFVYDEMFPLARRTLPDYLKQHWHDDALQSALQQMAADAGATSLQAWYGSVRDDIERQAMVARHVEALMDQDSKATGLKQLQGQIWQSAFESGTLRAHVYDDVPSALRRWHERGLNVRIYSSGSIQAQQLFFGHTVAGDLLPLLGGHYDTTTGPKREASSYQRIAADMQVTARQIVFLSDVLDELDAARQAGMQTILVLRPGNATVAQQRHREVANFADL